MLTCPKCGSSDVRSLESYSYDVNTDERVGLQSKHYDSYSHAYCMNFDQEEMEYCNWEGKRRDLVND